MTETSQPNAAEPATATAVPDIRPVDPAVPGQPCECDFTPYRAPDEAGEESWHFLRKCQACGREWYGLHCPHDGVQNPCPGCGVRPTPVTQDIVWQGVCRTPVALVLLPWEKGGTTVAELDADGTLYGCRDVGFGTSHDGIVTAWTKGAGAKGQRVDDHRPPQAERATCGYGHPGLEARQPAPSIGVPQHAQVHPHPQPRRAPASADSISAGSERAMHKAGNRMASALRRIVAASRAGQPIPGDLVDQAERAMGGWREALAS